MRRSPCIFSWDPNWPLLRLSINRARGWPLSPATLEFRNHGPEPASKSRIAEHVSSPPGKVGMPFAVSPSVRTRTSNAQLSRAGGWMVMLPYLSLFGSSSTVLGDCAQCDMTEDPPERLVPLCNFSRGGLSSLAATYGRDRITILCPLSLCRLFHRPDLSIGGRLSNNLLQSTRVRSHNDLLTNLAPHAPNSALLLTRVIGCFSPECINHHYIQRRSLIRSFLH